MATLSAVDAKQGLAKAIIEFLHTSLTDGTVSADDQEAIEVAASCIGETFGVDASNRPFRAGASNSDQDLLSIYIAHNCDKANNGDNSKGIDEGNSVVTGKSRQPDQDEQQNSEKVHAEDARGVDAEGFKIQGNIAMQNKDYPQAISMYSRAISLRPANAIYLSNRAAAYSATQQHELAEQDAEMAVSVDPAYSKAWSRLGLARFALDNARGSMEAYQKGIKAEGKGGSEAMKKGFETAKRIADRQQDSGVQADNVPTDSTRGTGLSELAAMASQFGIDGNAMPNLSQLMNNPALKQMTQNMMQNPEMMQNMLNNPNIRDMIGQFAGTSNDAGRNGETKPNLTSMLQDPAIAEMATKFANSPR